MRWQNVHLMTSTLTMHGINLYTTHVRVNPAKNSSKANLVTLIDLQANHLQTTLLFHLPLHSPDWYHGTNSQGTKNTNKHLDLAVLHSRYVVHVFSMNVVVAVALSSCWMELPCSYNIQNNINETCKQSNQEILSISSYHQPLSTFYYNDKREPSYKHPVVVLGF